MSDSSTSKDLQHLTRALELAHQGFGFTSPNPCVGAVLVKAGKILGEGWHHQAGKPHAEIEALRDCAKRGHASTGATLYVTLEPCSSHGQTPPCTEAILAAGISRVVVATRDPNPRHAGQGLRWLRRHGVDVVPGPLRAEAARLNEAFNHWIVHGTPFVTVKAAMTLDGRIATANGDSHWVTGAGARRHAMNHFRRGADAIVTGINTILADDPSLTYRGPGASRKRWHRIVLDSHARTPLTARVVTDEAAEQTNIVVTDAAPPGRVKALRKRVNVIAAPTHDGRVDLHWLIAQLGREEVTHLLVEGGGEVNGSFLAAGLAHRIAFYYSPKILGGRDSRPGVAGPDPARLAEAFTLSDCQHIPLGKDWLITGLLSPRTNK